MDMGVFQMFAFMMSSPAPRSYATCTPTLAHLASASHGSYGAEAVPHVTFAAQVSFLSRSDSHASTACSPASHEAILRLRR